MGKGDTFSPPEDINFEWQINWYPDNHTERTKNWMSGYIFNLDLSSGWGFGFGIGSRITGDNFEQNQWTRVTFRIDPQYIHFIANEGPWLPYFDDSGNGDHHIDYTVGPEEDPHTPGPITLGNGDAPLRIGTEWLGTDFMWLNGKLDELRMSNAYRSDAWEKACYYSESDNLLSLVLLP
jgi:hypothetical protein